MAGQRQPIQLVVAKGKKHLTKNEIETRTNVEVQPCTDDLMKPPAYLSAAQKKRFLLLAEQLNKIGIIGETDAEALARYITAEFQYESVTKQLRELDKKAPVAPKSKDSEELTSYYTQLELWSATQSMTAKLQDRYFKQAQTAARDLGLTISSRCRLQVPVAEDRKEKKKNKFSQFMSGGEAM